MQFLEQGVPLQACVSQRCCMHPASALHKDQNASWRNSRLKVYQFSPSQVKSWRFPSMGTKHAERQMVMDGVMRAVMSDSELSRLFDGIDILTLAHVKVESDTFLFEGPNAFQVGDVGWGRVHLMWELDWG